MMVVSILSLSTIFLLDFGIVHGNCSVFFFILLCNLENWCWISLGDLTFFSYFILIILDKRYEFHSSGIRGHVNYGQ